jgi:hypothetical protein
VGKPRRSHLCAQAVTSKITVPALIQNKILKDLVFIKQDLVKNENIFSSPEWRVPVNMQIEQSHPSKISTNMARPYSRS